MPDDIVLPSSFEIFEPNAAAADDLPEPPPPAAGEYDWAIAGTTGRPPDSGASRLNITELDVTFAWTLADKPVPARRWIVPDWIPRQQVTLLSGDGGTGKSLISMQLMVAAASGTPWLGLPVETVSSFAIFAEDDDTELHIRLASITRAARVSIADLKDLVWRSAVVDPCEMIEVDDRGSVRPTPYYRWLEKTVIELGARLVVLDAATNLFGGDEIKRRQVNGFLLLLRTLAIQIDGAVLLLAHPSVQGIQTKSGMSGSTHWNNGVRSRLYFMADDVRDNAGGDPDPDVRVLSKKKTNYSRPGDILRVRWTAGAFLTLGAPETLDRAELSAKTDSVFLALLAKTQGEGMPVCPSLTARNYAPTVFAKHPASQGMPKKAFEQAMHRLLAAEVIKTVEYGKPSDRRKKLVLA
jgi:RecA-family ATPase